MEEIRITAEPADARRCKFIVSVPVFDGVRRFGSAAEAAGSPLAEALFGIAGVSEVLVSGSTVTVTKSDEAPWQAAGRQVGAAIRAALPSGTAPIALRIARSERAKSSSPRPVSESRR